MYPIAEPQFTTMLAGALAQVRNGVAYGGQAVGPHQVNIAATRCGFAGRGAESTEVERRAASLYGGHTRWVHGQAVELAFMGYPLAIQQRTQDVHGLDGALVTRTAIQCFAGKVGRDDVDSQSPAADAIERGDLSRELWWPTFAYSHRHQQLDALRDSSDGGGKSGGINA